MRYEILDMRHIGLKLKAEGKKAYVSFLKNYSLRTTHHLPLK